MELTDRPRMLSSIFKAHGRRSHGVRLEDGAAFTVEAGETLLEAALRSGLRVPHNCRVGACATCRCRIVSGKAKSLIDRAYVLQQEEIGNKVFLACQTLPLSDLVVDWERQREVKAVKAANGATIVGLRQLTPRVWRVSMSVEVDLGALPGQYVCVAMEPTPGRSLARKFSVVLATAAAGRTRLDIDVARRASGEGSNWLTAEDRIGAQVRIEGPFGNCVAPAGRGPLIAVGAGSGIGAAMGVVIHSHARVPARPTALLAYGARACDIYGIEEAADSARKAGTPHLSLARAEEIAAPTAAIASGRAPAGLATALTQAAGLAGADAGGHCQVLLYGPPGFVDCCIDSLARCSLPAEHIRYDRYEPYDAAPSPLPAETSLEG